MLQIKFWFQKKNQILRNIILCVCVVCMCLKLEDGQYYIIILYIIIIISFCLIVKTEPLGYPSNRQKPKGKDSEHDREIITNSRSILNGSLINFRKLFETTDYIQSTMVIRHDS